MVEKGYRALKEEHLHDYNARKANLDAAEKAMWNEVSHRSIGKHFLSKLRKCILTPSMLFLHLLFTITNRNYHYTQLSHLRPSLQCCVNAQLIGNTAASQQRTQRRCTRF